MVLFWPIQQELDCINDSGHFLGKIRFDGATNKHIFCASEEGTGPSSSEKLSVAKKLATLDSGNDCIPMQDDD